MSSSKNLTFMTNVVDADTLHSIQSRVLHTLSNYLSNSFGPYGSTTIIKKQNVETMYTKDGHTILSNIHFNGVIEEDIKENIETITRYIVKSVGDGTTSAVILSSYIFDDLNRLIKENKYRPKDVYDILNKMVKTIKQLIISDSNQCTIDNIYDIAMISTNGNKDLSMEIYQVYKKFGLNVFIDVSPSLSGTTFVKIYDGMVINTGLGDQFYVNNNNNTCSIDAPEVYFFEHPIDTREMAIYMDAILERNILNAIKTKNPADYIPTVIIAPNISQDLSSYMDYLSAAMQNVEPANRPPLLIITGTHQVEELYDIADLCGARMIRKYIDDKMKEIDLANGNAPTPDTIYEWAGHCAKVESDTLKTKFVRPALMYQDSSSDKKTLLYTNRLDFLEKELEAAKDRGEDAHTTGTLKRRINSLKSNMVEIFVGGISSSDRDSIRDLVEDAVLNCRSAAINGVGWGANFNAMNVIEEMYIHFHNKKTNATDLEKYIIASLRESYERVIKSLYASVYTPEEVEVNFSKSIFKKQPINLSTKEFDGKVKCSIDGDIIVLEAIAKIIGLMVTSNQYILQNPVNNVYVDPIK